MKKFIFPECGDQVRYGDETLEIAEVGTGVYIAWGSGLVPVAFADKTVGICCFSESKEGEQQGGVPMFRAWVPDLPEAAEVLSHATAVNIEHGIGSDVFHVRVTAADGRRALIRLFYNAKKMGHDRQDELQWLSEPQSA